MRDFFKDIVIRLFLVFAVSGVIAGVGIAGVGFALAYPLLSYDCAVFGNTTGLPTKMEFGSCYAQVDGQWVARESVQPQRLPRQ